MSLSLYIYCIYFILGYKPPKANWQLKSSTRSCKGSNIQFIEPQPRRDCQWRRGRRPPVTVGSGPLKFGKEIGPHPTGEPSLEGFRIPFFSQPFEVTLSIRQELHSTTSLTRNNKIPLLQTGWLWIFSDDVFSFSFTHLALWNGLLVQKILPLSFLAWRVQGIFDALGQLLHTAIQHEKFFGNEQWGFKETGADFKGPLNFGEGDGQQKPSKWFFQCLPVGANVGTLQDLWIWWRFEWGHRGEIGTSCGSSLGFDWNVLAMGT